jgi:diguanylate cyclase (GGDEF)-like protein
LLVIIGTAFVLLAQYSGKFNPVLLANVVLLFMVIPLVPWALRESLTAIGLIYLIFSLSTLTVDGRFKPETIWLLQFLMLSAGFATLAVIVRQVTVRKHDISTRYALENAHRTMQALSYKDPLTGAYNRRYLNEEFERIHKNFKAANRPLHFALFDLDDFKQLNDTQGHDAGDKLLQTLCEAFLSNLQPGDYLFRLGGDEFALIFAADDPESWLAALQRVCQEQGVPINYSVGLATLKSDQVAELADLYNLADRRLYSAKRRKKGGRSPMTGELGSGQIAQIS